MKPNRWSRTRASAHDSPGRDAVAPPDDVQSLEAPSAESASEDESLEDAADVKEMHVAESDGKGRLPGDQEKSARRHQKITAKLGLAPNLRLFTCGCGDLTAESLCKLLFSHGIQSVLDVRALPKSKKKPWFNADSLAKDMRATGLRYEFVGKGRKSHTVVATRVQKCEQLVCLLGFRGSPTECARLVLSEKLVKGLDWHIEHLEPSFDLLPPRALVAQDHAVVFGKYMAAIDEIRRVQTRLEQDFGFLGHWRDRVLASYSSKEYKDWDGRVSAAEPTVITLPWGSVMMVLPHFLSGVRLTRIQRETLPGAIAYEQPRRLTLSTGVGFTQQFKEAWLCKDYDFADPKRATPPHRFARRSLEGWSETLLVEASHAAKMPFNGALCRWDPPGEIKEQGSQSFARGSPMLEYTAVAMLGVTGSRHCRVHGLGCWEKLAVDVPIHEGSLVVFGGPLKERWLYRHMRDNEVRGERVLLTLQLHAESSQSNDATTRMLGRSQRHVSQAEKAPCLKKPIEPPSEQPAVCLADTTCRARWRRSKA